MLAKTSIFVFFLTKNLQEFYKWYIIYSKKVCKVLNEVRIMVKNKVLKIIILAITVLMLFNNYTCLAREGRI